MCMRVIHTHLRDAESVLPVRTCLVTQSCPTLCDPMDCSPSGSSVHGILQARVLEWVAISFSRGSFRQRDWTRISRIFCIGMQFFTTEPLQ